MKYNLQKDFYCKFMYRFALITNFLLKQYCKLKINFLVYPTIQYRILIGYPASNCFDIICWRIKKRQLWNWTRDILRYEKTENPGEIRFIKKRRASENRRFQSNRIFIIPRYIHSLTSI